MVSCLAGMPKWTQCCVLWMPPAPTWCASLLLFVFLFVCFCLCFFSFACVCVSFRLLLFVFLLVCFLFACSRLRVVKPRGPFSWCAVFCKSCVCLSLCVRVCVYVCTCVCVWHGQVTLEQRAEQVCTCFCQKDLNFQRFVTNLMRAVCGCSSTAERAS